MKYLREEKKQLREKENYLREEKKQLLEKENYLREEKKQLQEKEKQLRDEKQLLLRRMEEPAAKRRKVGKFLLMWTSLLPVNVWVNPHVLVQRC